MSRAFVKEQDSGAPGQDLPERPVSEHPNYVTPAGLAALEREAGELEAQRLELLARGDDPMAAEELAHIDRDLRYIAARLDGAITVDPADQPADEVAFGAAVTVIGDGGERTFTIVGEDEADLAVLKVSCVSPLAEALIGARVGDRVTWRRPAGDLELTVKAIAYDRSGAG
jgi:transcription elongation GreA/GreB family factor